MAPSLDLSPFFKGSFEENPEAALPALMRAVLTRTQFLPAVRHVIGWRGLRQSAGGGEGWTAKIRGHAGVFGLFFAGGESAPGWTTGRFGLCYFPDPEEPLVERCSLRAAAVTQSADYWPRVRDFLQHPDMGELFRVGSLLLSVRAEPCALALVMQSPSSLRTVAREGVSLMQAGQMVQLVAPGDCDQDLPAWDTAFEFFDVLTASLTFNLGQPPGCLIERRYPATQWVYDCGGAIFSEDAPDLWSGLAALGYGEGDFEALCTAVSAAAGAPLSSSKAEGPDTAAPSHPDRLWWRAHRLKDFSCVDKKILGVDERPPLIVLTGFLGSGKTSFLQHFVEYQTQRSRFVAVIQNEIGAIGLDGKLLDYTVTEIDEGCVCCSLAGNLKRAVRGILEDFSPDYIILETSGLANPKNLLDDLGELEELVRRDATVTVVDALNFPSSLADCAIAADQVAAANVLLLNKCDLVGAAQLEAVKRQLAALNAAAPVCLTRGGNVHPALIFDAESGPEAGDPDSAPGASQPAQRHRTHSADGWRARTVTFTRTLDRRRFLEAIDAVSASIFRIKGVIDLSDPPQTLLFQYVAGRYELSVFPDSRVSQRFLTLIGQAAAPGILRCLESRLRAAEL